MFSRTLTKYIAMAATAIAIGGGAYGIVGATASTGSDTAGSDRGRRRRPRAGSPRLKLASWGTHARHERHRGRIWRANGAGPAAR